MAHAVPQFPAGVLDQPHLQRFKVLLDEINRESPRGKVLVSASLLDDHLGEIIAARLVAHFAINKLITGFNAPLGTFSARITGALALGVISEDEYHDLEIIRAVRNHFAHQLKASFADDSIKDRCGNLKAAAQPYADVVMNAEGRFTTAAVALIMHLTNRAHYVALKRLSYEPWQY